MTDEKLPKKWAKETKTIKAVQIAFDVAQDVQQAVKMQALERGVSPSDQIREILGLPVKYKRVRPRLTVSLTEDDFIALANRYGIDAENKQLIREKANSLIIEHVKGSNKSKE